MINAFVNSSFHDLSFNTHIAEVLYKRQSHNPLFPISGYHFENVYGLCHYHDSDEINNTS